MSWISVFELFVIISLIVCAVKVELEKVKIEKEKEKVEKERKEWQEIADRANATLDKAKILYNKLNETMLWFAHEAGDLQIYSMGVTKIQYIKVEDLSNLIMKLTDKIYKIK